VIIKTAEFKKSSADLDQCPKDRIPEFAFIGRSNVGKSSLINLLTGNKKLARTSVSPGKTRLINHFLIDNSWYLVDLPGYGYAKTSKRSKEIFLRLINDYLLKREQLLCVFVLLDIRINPQHKDKSFINWLGINKIPFVLVFTKTDKLNQREINKSRKRYFDELMETWETLPRCFYTSTVHRSGRESILEFIGTLIDPEKQ